jgi:isochorismate pyruvate lyase
VDAQSTSGLTEIREAINGLDERIVALIGQRQAWVERAGRLKRDQDEDAVRAPSRVDAVIARVRALATLAGASPEVVERTYRAMIAAFVDLEMRIHAR